MKLNIDRSDWKKVKLGDVATAPSIRINNPSESGFDYFIGNANIGQWDFRLTSWEPTDSVTSAMKGFETGDYLFVRRSLYASDFRERSPRASFPGVCSGDIITIREDPEKIANGFLIGVLNSPAIWKYVVANASGSITRRIKWRDLANYEFLLPPKDQQAKLAELLWAADEEVEALAYTQEAAIKLRDSTFKLFTETLDKKYSKKVADLLIDGPRNGFSPKTSDDGASYTVSIGAVKNGRFTPEGNLKKATVEQSTLEKFNVQENDVFVVRGNGNRLLCGKAGLATESAENLFYPDLLIRLRFNVMQINPEFATYQWNHPSAHYRLLQWAKSTNGISKINGADIKNHTLLVPPISEQSKILNKIGKIEKRVAALGEAKADALRLKKSLINQIF